MQSISNLIIMHYHLRLGGVTDVITRAVQVLIQEPLISHITLAVGEELPLPRDEFMKKFTTDTYTLQEVKKKLTLHIEPAIGYTTSSDSTALHSSLQQFFQSIDMPHVLWWIHNHHLGKNTLFTKILMEYIHSHPAQTILQIHDFPEAARYQNLSNLTNTMNIADAYRTTPTSSIAVINSHDLQVLNNSGVPSVLIPNIVPTTTGASVSSNTTRTSTDIKQALAHAFPQHLELSPSAPYTLFTYPVRCIRRKNVLEAALITKMYEQFTQHPCALCVTLEGTSEQERGYSQLVAQLYANGHIRGYFNIGNNLSPLNIDFNEVCKASDTICSSSTQEGFGFSFLSTVSWETPLLARHIASVQDIYSLLTHTWPSCWYSTIAIARTLLSSSHIQHITECYTQKIEFLSQYYTHAQIVKIQKEVESIVTQSHIDFSFLPIPIQVHILQHFQSLAPTILEDNTTLLQQLEKTINDAPAIINRDTITATQEKIHSNYSGQVFKEVFYSIANTLQQAECSPNESNPQVAYAIQNSFLNIENIRALYEPLSYEE